MVALRAAAELASPVDLAALPSRSRRGAIGPAVLAEPDCTIWVPEGWRADPGEGGALLLRRVGRGMAAVSGGRDRFDPATLQVWIARLTGVAEEMSAVLRRASFSPNIKERADCSSALFSPEGELVVQAENIPVHLGSMPASVAVAIRSFGATIRPGEQIILNDPFDGGTHLNDVTLVAGCFVEDRLVGWVANRAHHADVGGAAPGSLPADATEVFQEGLRIPPLRLTEEVRAMLLANTRTPWERRGDLDAQVGANRVGAARLAELLRRTPADAGARTPGRRARLRRAPHAGRRSPPCPMGPGASPTSSTPRGAVPTSRRRPGLRWP